MLSLLRWPSPTQILINVVTACLREEYKEFQKSIKENLMEAEVQQEEDEVCDGNLTIALIS